MNIVILVKLVPDLVEELEIDASGSALDTTFMRQIINEPDEHALEQALLLKESMGAEVIVIGLGKEGMDDVLFTAAAKGADRQIDPEAFGYEKIFLNDHQPNRHENPVHSCLCRSRTSQSRGSGL